MPRTMVLWNGDALPQSFAFFYLAFAILAIFRELLGLMSWFKLFFQVSPHPIGEMQYERRGSEAEAV